MGPLATAGELGFHLQRDDLDPDVADQAVQLASGAVRAYCQWDITETTETLWAVGNGLPVLTLPTMMLSEVLNVEIDGEQLDLLDPLALTFSRTGQLFRALGWPKSAQIRCDCRHGYDPVPDVLKLVTLELAARGINNPQGLLSAATSTVSRTFANANGPRLSELDQRLLDRYVI